MNPDKVAALNTGQSPIVESGLAAMITKVVQICDLDARVDRREGCIMNSPYATLGRKGNVRCEYCI